MKNNSRRARSNLSELDSNEESNPSRECDCSRREGETVFLKVRENGDVRAD